MLFGLSAAAPAGVVLNPAPDIFANSLSAVYNAGSNSLSVDGVADQLTAELEGSLTTFIIDGGTFSLDAQINNAGIASSGTLSIGGCVSDLTGVPSCPSSGVLLEGNLTSFSFEPTPDGQLTFEFSVTGGDLQPLYGNRAYVLLNLIDFPGGFGEDFTILEDFSNVADTGVAPEPGTWAFLILGLGGFCLVRRRSRIA